MSAASSVSDTHSSNSAAHSISQNQSSNQESNSLPTSLNASNVEATSGSNGLRSTTSTEKLANSTTTTEQIGSEPTAAERAIGIGSLDAAQSGAHKTQTAVANGSTSSEESTRIESAVVGVSAAVSREQVVQGVLGRSYQAGLQAPQVSYSGDVYRGVGTSFENTALAYDGFPGAGKGQRYNADGQHTIYGGPTQAAAVRELGIYDTTADRTYTRFQADVTVNPATGQGGLADVNAGLRQQNLPSSALTQPTNTARVDGADALHRLTGEHRYSAPQQVSKGAVDAGAAAIRAPSSIGGDQINVLPANAPAGTLTPVSRQTMSPDGSLGPIRPAASVAPMSPYSSRVDPGAVNMPAGTATRASSVRYGAMGAAGDTVVQAGIDLFNGRTVDATQFGQDMAVNTAVGASAAKLTDALTPRMGSLKAGGAIGGAIQATVSGYSNYRQYNAGEISGERAIANTVVDTGTAIAAGATGAAVGAMVGSVVPVAGTAVGAVVGFGVGVGAHYAIQAVDSVTGFTSAAKDGLTSGLEAASDWVSSWW